MSFQYVHVRKCGGLIIIFFFWQIFAANICGDELTTGNDEYLQTVWTTEDGLPQNSVNDILQSRDGYIWLATFGGLARFDGIKFTIFNSGNTPGFMSNRILSLLEDKNGAIWLTTQSGEVMTFKDGAGKTYTTADGLPDSDALAIKETRDGTIWVGTTNGLAKFQSGKFSIYTKQDGLPDNHIWSFNEDSKGHLWGITNKGLFEFEGKTFTIFNPSDGFPENSWLNLITGSKGNLWLNTKNGLASFADGKFISYFNPKIKSDQNIITIYEGREGVLWISYALQESIYRFQNGIFTAYRIKGKQEVLRTMFEDREGSLWMGTDGGGLIRLKKRKIQTYSTADGLPNDSVRGVVDDNKGGVWVAGLSGLSQFKDGKFTTYTNEDGMLSYELSALCFDRAGNLWIGSNYGLSKFKDGKFTNYTTELGVSNSQISSLFEDRDGNLWIGTVSGLSKLHDGKFTVLTQSNGLVNNDVRYIMQTQDGALWFGTSGGLSRLQDGIFTNYTTEQGLSNNFIRDIFEEPDGTIWLGTYGGGLNRLKDGNIKSITSRNGLFDDFISRILPDERGNFWMLGNRGIFKVSRAGLNDFSEGRSTSFMTTSYGVEDGMLSSEGNGGVQPAGWKMSDGKMWFPTIKGIAVIETDITNTLPPPIVIEKVIIDRAAAPINRSIEVNPGQENLEIEYTGLSFTRPAQVKFKYQLVGLDADWVNVGTRRTAYYSYLPSGEYTFQVMAENGDGVWSVSPATINIVVYPPFWRTWWFWLLCALIIVFLVFVIFRFRIAQLKRAHAAQEEFSHRLINAHETERRRIAAELHDSIGQSLAMIKNTAVFGTNNSKNLETAKQQLEQISSQSAHAITEVREIAYNLRPYLLDRLGLTKAISSLLNKIAAANVIKINVEIDEIDNLFAVEAEMSIYRIIQESLNNILKHADASEVFIVIRKKENSVSIKIQDNGRGFETQAVSNENKQGGFGLLGMSERVRMLGGNYSIESSRGNGTTVFVGINPAKLQRRE